MQKMEDFVHDNLYGFNQNGASLLAIRINVISKLKLESKFFLDGKKHPTKNHLFKGNSKGKAKLTPLRPKWQKFQII